MHVFSRNPAADPVDDLESCAEAIRNSGWWNRCELTEQWPLSTEQAAELLADAGELDVDVESLADLIDRRLIPAPATGDNSEFEWLASDIVAAVGVLNNRQQWRPTPSGHDALKHPCQLALEQARAAGEVDAIVAAVPGVPRFDVRHLLELLVVTDIGEGRRKLVTLLKAVLEVDHGVFV